jgi:hypothetical protein
VRKLRDVLERRRVFKELKDPETLKTIRRQAEYLWETCSWPEDEIYIAVPQRSYRPAGRKEPCFVVASLVR